MRDNPIKRALQNGGTAAGAMVFELMAPGLPQICRNAGADFLLYDMEHTGLGFESLKTQVALCRGLNVVPMARVPRGEYHFISRALDIGALGSEKSGNKLIKFENRTNRLIAPTT